MNRNGAGSGAQSGALANRPGPSPTPGAAVGTAAVVGAQAQRVAPRALEKRRRGDRQLVPILRTQVPDGRSMDSPGIGSRATIPNWLHLRLSRAHFFSTFLRPRPRGGRSQGGWRIGALPVPDRGKRDGRERFGTGQVRTVTDLRPLLSAAAPSERDRLCFRRGGARARGCRRRPHDVAALPPFLTHARPHGR